MTVVLLPGHENANLKVRGVLYRGWSSAALCECDRTAMCDCLRYLIKSQLEKLAVK